MGIIEPPQGGRRLALPKRVRESLNIGDKVLVINAGDHLKVISLPSDPFKVLHEAFNVRKPFKELRRRVEELAEREVKG